MELYQGDCLSILPTLSSKSVDMILCDLPYGITAAKTDIRLDLPALWEEYHRVAKDTAAIVLFGQGIFYIDLVNSNRAEYRYDMVWDKVLTSGHLNCNKMPLRQHEQIAVFYRKLPTYHPQFTEGIPLHSMGTAYLTADIKNRNYGKMRPSGNDRAGTTQKYPTSIMHYQKPHPSVCLHPTEKPVELLRCLIRTYTNQKETVLDSCMGSGSTGVAAKAEDRNFIGIELDPEYFAIAQHRLGTC